MAATALNGTSDGPQGVWTADELKNGKSGVDAHDVTVKMSLKTSKSVKKLGGSGKVVDPMDWGLPGYLTDDEVATFMKFRDEVEKRDDDFKKTVYSFGVEEGEAFTLCRWLRARKFVFDDVIAMIEEATKVHADARKVDYYPDPVAALGCDPSVFMAQYPQLYHGNAKNGCPVFISKPGVLSVDGMECITTLDGILKYHWHVMMIDYKRRLIQHKEEDPSFSRFESITVIDLDKLSTSQLNSRALNIVKTQTGIDSVCFPETMNRTLVINAPRFFTMTWKIIKGWIDPRTAGKIELISNRSSWEARLLELVDADQLPSDYGGKGVATTVTLSKEAPEGVIKQFHHLLSVRSNGSYSVEVPAGGELEVKVYTRAPAEATFSIVDETNKSTVFVKGVVVKHTGGASEIDQPTSVLITSERISGPAKLKIKVDSKGGRFSAIGNYMLACNIHEKK